MLLLIHLHRPTRPGRVVYHQRWCSGHLHHMAGGLQLRRKGFEVFDIRSQLVVPWRAGSCCGMKRNTFVVHITESVTAFWDGNKRGDEGYDYEGPECR